MKKDKRRERLAKIVSMMQEGMTYREIASHFNCTHQNIERIVSFRDVRPLTPLKDPYVSMWWLRKKLGSYKNGDASQVYLALKELLAIRESQQDKPVLHGNNS